MSQKLVKEIHELVRRALVPVGWRKHSGGIFSFEINKETLGVLGLNRADDWGRQSLTRINPVVGVRNHAIERLKHELSSSRGPAGAKPYAQASTITSPLGYLMPENTYRTWTFDEGADNAATADEMVAAIDTYGRRFMEAYASLPAIAAALADLEGSPVPADAVALANYLLGDAAAARQALARVFNPDLRAALGPYFAVRER